MRKALIVFCVTMASPNVGWAFVGGAAGGKPGDTTVEASVGLERGLIEPNENEDSWQDARWNLFNLNLSHTFGALGPLLDVFVRVGGTFVISPAERNQRTEIDPANCLGKVTGEGGCEFYPRDTGAIARLAVGFHAIHTQKLVLGFSFETNVPVGVEFEKFANPRVDYLAGSVQLGVQVTDWLSYETNLYVGSGPFGKQNAQLAYTQLFGARYRHPSFTLGLKVGPYVDADITQRFDERYDAAYTAGYPDTRDRIRMARFGSIASPYVTLGERLTLRATYLQKFFGYDAAATQYLEFGVAIAF